MSDKTNTPESGETRQFISDALNNFRTIHDPNERLRSLWKIGQLIDGTTDEELYELAAAAAVEEDHRLRGEICYTISRSQRPRLRMQLVQLLKKMAQDPDPYVRRSAIAALSQWGGIQEATLSAIEPILEDVDRLKNLVTNLGKEIASLQDGIRSFAEVNISDPQGKETEMDDYMRSWETYLRNESRLLREHRGEFVAIYREEIIGIDKEQMRLAETVYQKYGSIEALLCKIEREDEIIQMPPPREIVG